MSRVMHQRTSRSWLVVFAIVVYNSHAFPLRVGPARQPLHLPLPQSSTALYQAASAPEEPEKKNLNVLQQSVRNLAQISLDVYDWLVSIRKSNEADRMVEESIARMRGEEYAPYVRPMDAAKIGPLGRFEKSAVDFIRSVFEEEGRRAEQIVNSDGKIVRPKDAGEDIGPLGFLEKQYVEILQKIQNSEEERVKAKILRPKDLDETVRGPLGELEYKVIQFFEEVRESERLRFEQTKTRGGEIVRPIDIPGPLGEFEMAVSEVFQAEQRRALERRTRNGQIVRPKDAKVRGPLGEAEFQVYEALKQLSAEESERWRSITRVLQDKRPMDTDPKSFFGVVETILVGIVRAPFLVVGVFERVKELLSSDLLNETDAAILEKERRRSSQKPGDGAKRKQ